MGGELGIRAALGVVAGTAGRVRMPGSDLLAVVAAPEIARAAAHYRPRFGTLSVDDVARGRALVRDALDGLQVVPVVNRWSRPGVPAIADSDAFVGTVHTLAPRNVADRMMRSVRGVWERSRDMHGDGPLAGRTVFASAQFVPRSTIQRHGGDVLAGLDDVAARRGAYGIARFGDHAYVLDTSVLSRATVSGRDSGTGLSPARIAPLEQLDDVVLERLARSHGFQHDPLTGVNDYRIGIDGAGSATTRRASLRRLLHETPNRDAIARMQVYLTGSTMTDINHMVELQVRGPRGRDVLAARPELSSAAVDAVGI